MRHHTKASLSGGIVGAVGLLVSLALLLPASAVAAEPHPFLGNFGSLGAGGTGSEPSFANPGGLAVDQATGDVLAIHFNPSASGSIERFKPDGTADPFSALGTNVIDGKRSGGTNECPTVPADCDETPGNEGILSNEGAGSEVEIAVAPPTALAGTAGNIFATDAEHGGVDVFSSAGAYLTQFSGVYPCGVAVAPNGNVFVGDYSEGKVFKLVPSGPSSYVKSITGFSTTHPCQVAATEGFVFAAEFEGPAKKIDSEGAEEGTTKYTVDSGANLALNVDPSDGHLYTAPAEGVTTKVKEYDVSGASPVLIEPSIEPGNLVAGIAINGTSGNVYVRRGGNTKIEVYGPRPAPPTVTSVVPNEGPLAGEQTVTIEGTNLAGASEVKFGATAVACPGVKCLEDTATKIKVKSPAHAAGQVDVTVVAPGGTSAIVVADHYTYVAAPTVTSVLPNEGPLAGEQTVTIEGTNLAGASEVKFGATAVACPGVKCLEDTATKIKVKSPAHAAGQVDVTVVAPGGTSAIVVADHYTYVAAPTVTSVVPNEGPLAGEQTVTIEGTNLAGASEVKFGATAVACPGVKCLEDTATKIKVKSPAHAAGQVDVTVTIPVGGTSAIVVADHYTYVAAPVVTDDAVGAIAQTTAVLNGHVNNNGAAAGSTCKFVVALQSAPGTPVTEPACTTSPVHGSASTAVQATATGLSANTKYVYRVVATNIGGETTGTPDQAFTTLLPTHTLTVTKAGSGSGSVTCNGGACASTYSEGTEVTLAATAASGSGFAGWSGGGCSGTGTCKVTIDADTTVTATFNANPSPPTPTPTPTPAPAPTCAVPKLAGKTLGQAKSALKAAHCALGKVTKPKKKKGPLVVKSSSPGAGKTLAADSKVNLKLGPKPKKKH